MTGSEARVRRTSWIGLLFVGLCAGPGRLRRRLWRWWYNLLARRDARADLLFMNYGYSEETDAGIALDADEEAYRFPIQLYLRVVRGQSLRGRQVLEVGSGRGGGAAFLARHLQPASYLGIDLSDEAVRWCRENHRQTNLAFRQGAAEALPVDNGSMDVVINVESSHCYADIDQFLTEVMRVLRPGGVFCLCDMRTLPGVEAMELAFQRAGFTAVQREDITPQVLKALDRVSGDRVQLIRQRVPRLLRRLIEDFTGVRGSALYRRFQNGDLRYFCWQWRKPLVNEPVERRADTGVL